MVSKLKIAQDWLPRYTGSQIDELGDYILLTNFKNYVSTFAERFNCEIKGEGGAMQSATNSEGLSIINFGIGSPNAALIMDLLSAKNPKSVLFLGTIRFLGFLLIIDPLSVSYTHLTLPTKRIV